jgi:YD repeat-containing protein
MSKKWVPQLILFSLSILAIYGVSAGFLGVQGHQGPPIKSTFETVYHGEVDEQEIHLDDSLAFNILGLDTLFSVMRTYGENGLLIREDHHDFKPNQKKKEYADYWVTFVYDLKDSLILETVYAAGKELYTISSERNENGHIISRREGENFASFCDYSYNKNGQLMSSVCEGFMYSVRANYSYDKNGRMSRIISSSGSDGIWKTFFEYDELDRVIQDSTVKFQKNYDSSVGEPDFLVEYSTVTNYAYNEQGDLVNVSGNENDDYYYEYDEFGNWIVKMIISHTSPWIFATITIREITYDR